MPYRPPKVALLVETSGIYGRQILDGIARFLRGRHGWSIFVEQRELRATPPIWLKHQHWQGVISRVADPGLARDFQRMGVPVVDLNDLYNDLGFPRIISDNPAIGRLGAEHLRERGFRHFGFCGFAGETWSAERREGFVAAVRQMGCDYSIFESPWHGPQVPEWDHDQRNIRRWIRSCPLPVAILACNDVRGQHVLTACAAEGITVPEEVAVVGVDNEETFCALCSPPLSSIVPNPEQIGYEAATLLEKLMVGKKTAQRLILIPPIKVVVRQSTEVLAVADRRLVAAVRYIREHALHGCDVRDILRNGSLSRSSLEQLFRKHLGQTPRQVVRSVQLQRAKNLLAESDFPLGKIAELTGFDHPEYFSVFFKRETGQTPGAFRRKLKDGGGRP